MARFKKKIVSAGVYRLPDGSLVTITPERLAHWVSEFNRYRKNGNRLPAPWTHIDPQTGKPVVMSPYLERSDINAGFWENLWVEDDPRYGTTLVGELEVPGDPDNPETPAGKVGTVVKETSVYVVPSFRDGKDNTYTDIPLHIALVTHPVQPGQENFQPAIAMSNLAYVVMSAAPPGAERTPSANPTPSASPAPGALNNTPLHASNPSIAVVLERLRACGIVLPDDTTLENFLERLLVALAQKAASENPDSTVLKPPEGAVTKEPAPVAMSITPESFASISREVFMSHPVAKELFETNQRLLAVLENQTRESRRARIDALVKSGRVTKETAEQKLYPLLEGLKMSFDEKGSPVPTVLDTILDVLESSLKPAASPRNALLSALSMSSGVVPADNPFIIGAQPDGFDAKDIADRFFEATS